MTVKLSHKEKQLVRWVLLKNMSSNTKKIEKLSAQRSPRRDYNCGDLDRVPE